jgi:hypothetical protein
MDVMTSLVTANKGDGLDVLIIADEVDGVLGSMDNIEDTCGDTGLLGKLSEDHSRTRILLRWLDDAGVSNDVSKREHPERDHGRKVERSDTGNDTKRLADGIGIHVSGNFEVVAQEHMRDSTGSLDNLQTTENITAGIG